MSKNKRPRRKGLWYRAVSVMENGYSDQGLVARVLAPVAAIVGIIVLVIVATPLAVLAKLASPFKRFIPRKTN